MRVRAAGPIVVIGHILLGALIIKVSDLGQTPPPRPPMDIQMIRPPPPPPPPPPEPPKPPPPPLPPEPPPPPQPPPPEPPPPEPPPRIRPPASHPPPRPAPHPQAPVQAPLAELPPMRVAPPPPSTTPGPPDSEVSARPIGGPELLYPQSMVEDDREGSADLECMIMPNGSTSNCQLLGTKGGAAFGRAALTYVQSARYKPAVRNGNAVTEEHHRLHVEFKLRS